MQISTSFGNAILLVISTGERAFHWCELEITGYICDSSTDA